MANSGLATGEWVSDCYGERDVRGQMHDVFLDFRLAIK